MSNNYANAPWGYQTQYRAQNGPVLPATPARLPNPIGQEGIKLLKKGGGGVNFVVTEEEVMRVLCNHRHNGRFDMYQDPDYPEGVFRCGICGDLVDFSTKFDPKLAQKIIDYLWAIYNNIKVNNNGIISEDIMKDLAYGMIMVRNMPKMLNMVTNNIQRQLMQNAWQPNGYRGPTYQNAVNMITGTPGYSYNPSYQSGDGNYWRAQDVIQMQQQQDYYQSQGGNPFAYSGPVQYVQQPMQQPMAPQYVAAPPPPQQYVTVTVPVDQYGNPVFPNQQYVQQPVQQMGPPPAAAATVVPETTLPPTPANSGGNNTEAPKVNKMFKR